MSYFGFAPYVPVAERRAKAAREMAKLAKKGRVVSPVAITGRKIAESFWGKAWCDNLENYSDYANRLPRGRTYVRNGSVCDLQIERGQVRAMVSGSSIYSITIDIATLPKARWDAICRDCAGSVGSLVELLQGKLSRNVMERVCRHGDGLFPSPGEIKLRCSCPDWADMCKHVAAALYGVGARLDAKPDLLFELRGVDRSQLIASAGKDLPMTSSGVASGRVLASDDLAAMFGIEMDTPLAVPAPAHPTAKSAPSKVAPTVPATRLASPSRAAPPAQGGASKVAAPVRTKSARAPGSVPALQRPSPKPVAGTPAPDLQRPVSATLAGSRATISTLAASATAKPAARDKSKPTRRSPILSGKFVKAKSRKGA
jgi:uncharacterized Zn finger protein